MTSTEPLATPPPAEDPHASLRAMVDLLARARTEAAKLADQVRTSRTSWEASNALLLSTAAGAARLRDETEANVRASAVALYRTSQEKHLVPGLDIKLGTTVAYKPDDAFAWAKQTGMALMLDRKAFEAIATVTSLPFVTRDDKSPKCSIATNLEEHGYGIAK